MTRSLDDRLEEIPRLEEPALRAAWARFFGRPPPKSISRRLLEHAAAYAVQASIHGGLRPAVRRKLRQVSQQQPGARKKRPRGVALPPGSRLVREWHGRSYTVEVLEQGFLHAGQRYRSLSEVARAITGARWSGPRFFEP